MRLNHIEDSKNVEISCLGITGSAKDGALARCYDEVSEIRKKISGRGGENAKLTDQQRQFIDSSLTSIQTSFIQDEDEMKAGVSGGAGTVDTPQERLQRYKSVVFQEDTLAAIKFTPDQSQFIPMK